MGFLNLFKSKKQLQPIDFSQIGVDMHSHLIPGIDDGSQSMDETIAMLAKFESLGYTKVITTPHIYGDLYKNTSKIILEGLTKVQETSEKIGLKITIEASAEYHCDEHFMELINSNNILSINNQYVLMEFPFLTELNNWNDYVFKLKAIGYTPIIAHFERYVYWHGSIEKAVQLKELGAKIQLNINSLSNHYGPDVKKQAERLIDAKIVDFLGSDCHKIQHLLLMESNANSKYLHKLLEDETLLNFTI